MNDIPYIQRWQDEQGLTRYETIAPLLDPELDPKKRNALRLQIAREIVRKLRDNGLEALAFLDNDKKKHLLSYK